MKTELTNKEHLVHPLTYIGLTDLGKKIYFNNMSITHRTSVDGILKIVSSCFDIPVEILLSPNRSRHVVQARLIAIMDIRANYPAMTLVDLGKIFGRDHSTIIYSINAFQDLSKYDKPFKALLAKYKVYTYAN